MARPEPVIVSRADQVRTGRPIPWLWKDHLMMGCVSVVAGGPAVGKSMLLSGDFAARVSNGTPWPDGSPCPAGSVAILSQFDSWVDTAVPWLAAHGADLSKVHFLSTGVPYGFRCEHDERWLPCYQAGESGLLTLDHIARINAALNDLEDLKLIIIDPIGTPSLPVMVALNQMAITHGAAVVLVVGLRDRSTRPRLADIGRTTLVSAARSVWLLERDPANPGRRLFTPMKNSLFDVAQSRLSGAATGHAFAMAEGRVAWEAAPLAPASPVVRLDEASVREKRDALAAAFLADFLKDGPRTWSVIEKYGKEAGHAVRALERVRGIIAENFKEPREERRWLWRLIGDKRTWSAADNHDKWGLPAGFHTGYDSDENDEPADGPATATEVPATEVPATDGSAQPVVNDDAEYEEDEDDEEDDFDDDEEDEDEEDDDEVDDDDEDINAAADRDDPEKKYLGLEPDAPQSRRVQLERLFDQVLGMKEAGLLKG